MIDIWHRQIPVRISLAMALPEENASAPTRNSFPAILGTGFNGSLALSTFHLKFWAQIDANRLGPEITAGSPERPHIRGFPARILDTRFFIRPNKPKTWQPDTVPPVEVPAPIFLLDAGAGDFRLPLLGMSALDRLQLRLYVDYRRRLVQLARHCR